MRVIMNKQKHNCINVELKNVRKLCIGSSSEPSKPLHKATVVLLLVTITTLLSQQTAAIVTNSFTDYLVLLYKGTYVAYGNGHVSERDLPECGNSINSRGGVEACNLSHHRYWQPPLVERLCRCPGHSGCPLHHYHTNNTTRSSSLQSSENGVEQQEQQPPPATPLMQHINNRAHLQFCNSEVTSSEIPVCNETNHSVGLTVRLVERHTEHNQQQQHHQHQVHHGGNVGQNRGGSSGEAAVDVIDTHTILHCQCHTPRYWTHVSSGTTYTTPNNSVNGGQQQHTKQQLQIHTHTYACRQLPRCRSYDACSAVRTDTFESYYTCSCPPNHLCALPRPSTSVVATATPPHTMPHYTGNTIQAVCTPIYSSNRRP